MAGMFHTEFSGLGGSMGHYSGRSAALGGPIYSQTGLPYSTSTPAEQKSKVSKAYWANQYFGVPVKTGVGILGGAFALYLSYLAYQHFSK